MEIILSAKGISKTYKTGDVEVLALKQCDLEIGRGQFVAIVGKSGSGKSTLLRILSNHDKTDTGTVTINGKVVNRLKEKELAEFRNHEIGFVYQDYSLFPEFTGYENIYMPLAIGKKKPENNEIENLLDELGIIHCKDKLPSQMSGGEQQRVAIARALITHPSVIFADEPTGNLDASGAELVVSMLREASRIHKQTIIMVTHDMQMAEYADRIITISDGIIES